MEAINFLIGWTKWLFLIIPVGASAMVTYYSVKKSLSLDSNSEGHYNERIRQTIRGAIIGMSISGFIELIKVFYM